MSRYYPLYLANFSKQGVNKIVRDTQGGGGRKSVTENFFAFLNTVSNAFLKLKVCLKARQGFKIHFLYTSFHSSKLTRL